MFKNIFFNYEIFKKFPFLFSILRFPKNFHFFFFSEFYGIRSDTRFYNSGHSHGDYGWHDHSNGRHHGHHHWYDGDTSGQRDCSGEPGVVENGEYYCSRDYSSPTTWCYLYCTHEHQETNFEMQKSREIILGKDENFRQSLLTKKSIVHYL